MARGFAGRELEGALLVLGRKNIAPAARVRLIEVSVSGALVESPLFAGLVVGSKVSVEFGARMGTAIVRQITAADKRGLCRYGIEFVAGELGQIVCELAQQDIASTACSI